MPDPGPALLALERGRSWAGVGEWEKAIGEYNLAVSLDPGLADGFRHRGVAQYKLDYCRVHDALADLDEAVRLAPGDPGALTDRAVMQASGWWEWMPGDVLGGAVRDVETAVGIDPGYTPALLGRLLVARRVERLRSMISPDEAHTAAVLVGRADITDLLARADVADLLDWHHSLPRAWPEELLRACPSGQWDGMVRWCDESLAGRGVLVAMGAEATVRGWWADATWAFDAAVRLDRDDPATHYALACVLADCPDPDPDGRRLARAFEHVRLACSMTDWKNDGYRERFRRIAEVREAHAREREHAEAGPTDPGQPGVAQDTLARLPRHAPTVPSPDHPG